MAEHHDARNGGGHGTGKGIVVAIDLGTSRSAWAFSIAGRAKGEIIIHAPEGSMQQAPGGGDGAPLLYKTETASLLEMSVAAAPGGTGSTGAISERQSTQPEQLIAFGYTAHAAYIEAEEEDRDWVLVTDEEQVGRQGRPRLPDRAATLAATESKNNAGEAAGNAAGEAVHDASASAVAATSAAGQRLLLFQWFKMGLSAKSGFTGVDQPMATAVGGQQLPLLTVMAATLHHFKEDVLRRLSAACGGEAINPLRDIDWVLTVPAIRDDFGKRFMRCAAHRAGLTEAEDSPRLRLCLEPEAACLAISDEDGRTFLREAGSKLMILDCGGGTVDVTTHQIVGTNPLRLKELLPPTGGPWGSTLVDRSFHDWLKGFLGADLFGPAFNSSALFQTMLQWEAHKMACARGAKVRLNLGDLCDHLGVSAARLQGLRERFNRGNEPGQHVGGNPRHRIVLLPPALVERFFVPAVTRIAACCEELAHRPKLSGLRYVFMVGGFSASPVLQEAVKAAFASATGAAPNAAIAASNAAPPSATDLEGLGSGPRVGDGGGRCSGGLGGGHDGEGDGEGGGGSGAAVVVTLRPNLAIVRGAVMSAAASNVFRSRKARLTYGVRSSVVFDPRNPDHCARCGAAAFNNWDGAERLPVFSAHVSRGTDLHAGGRCIHRRTYRPLSGNQSAITVQILASHKKDIAYLDDGDYFRLGTVEVPVPVDAATATTVAAPAWAPATAAEAAATAAATATAGAGGAATSAPRGTGLCRAETLIDVEFTFGEAELSVTCYRARQGGSGGAARERVAGVELNLAQELEEV